ncbi:MAG: Xaa-Pro aminopeptidase [Candidatus Cloacimonetes bacterium]|nr:Xaa-Pro aminopeptidase [Candidatus Cloacimonadota bacterium]
MDSSVLKARREKLGNALNNGEMVFIFAAEEPKGISKFLQNNNFLYLTGLYETPEAVFLCFKQKDKVYEYIYIQRNIPEMIVWDGAKIYPEEAKEISGIDNVKFLDEFEDSLQYNLSLSNKVFINTGLQNLNKPLNKQLFFASKIKERFLHLTYAEANQLMMPLRQIKDDCEIDFLSKAIEITGFGLESIFKNAKDNMYEYELEAMLFYEMRRRGLDHFGFAPIIASGVNATTLHYKKNNTLIAENELVLCDCGALFKNYSADITRTFPISTKFSKRQKDVYNEVLNVQKTIISMIKPGIGLTELNQKTGEMIGEACVRLGLIADVADYKKYYMHSVSHHLGMDTHDLGARDSILQEGMVITVEPGIYIKEENIGIRIEDDILVTKDSFKNLSFMIPKEIEELEEFRKK